MFTNIPKYTFNVTLPASTSKEVVEWFEIMENNNKLADALIELVYETIKSGKSIKAAEFLMDAYNDTPSSQSTYSTGQNNLFDNLYNWQESNNAIFKEEKKEKKKMLSV